MKQIAIFASGTGTNTANIIHYFRDHQTIKISLIVSNKPDAGVLAIAGKEKIPTLILEKEAFFRGGSYVDDLREKGIDLVVLAGFLWKVPPALVKAFPGRIINIHPALLPKYGGKGMYGRYVHEAVLAAEETESGITIHFVDEHYDNGQVIFQARVLVEPGDTPDSLAQKIHQLEYYHFPRIIEEVIGK